MELWRISAVQVSEFDYSIEEFEEYMFNVPTANFWTMTNTDVQCMMGEIMKADRYAYSPAVPRLYQKFFVDVSNGKIINMTCHHDQGDILWCERPSHEHKVIISKFRLTNVPIEIP
jgi:hypothetical protein